MKKLVAIAALLTALVVSAGTASGLPGLPARASGTTTIIIIDGGSGGGGGGLTDGGVGPWVWAVRCPSGTDCDTANTPFLGASAFGGVFKLTSARCAASQPGTSLDAGNLTINVYDVSDAGVSDSCTMACSSVTQVGNVCALTATLSSSVVYGVYTAGCLTQPVDNTCAISMGPP